MDISVVIPLYNGARWIEETLRSVLAQTHCPREIVVVDDGSDDGSRALVRSSFPEVELMRMPIEKTSKGAGPVRRYGLQHTTAPLVAFLDQDDLWHPDHLRILSRLLQNSEYPAAVAGLDHFHTSSTPTYQLQSDEVHLFSPWERYPLNSIHSPSCVLIRREALDRIGGWPSQFTISDMHAWFKLTTEAPMLQTEQVSVGKRVHRGSYLEQLRAEDASAFLRRQIRVCEDALAYRRDVTSESERIFQKRLETFKMLGEGLEGVLRGENQLLKDAARHLEEKRYPEQERIRAYWFFLLRLFSMPQSQIPTTELSKERQLLGRIVRGWPNQGPQARSALSEALTQTISYKAFLTYALIAPVRAVTSFLFLEGMRRQLERTVGQITASVQTFVDSTWKSFRELMRSGTAAVNQLRSGS